MKPIKAIKYLFAQLYIKNKTNSKTHKFELS